MGASIIRTGLWGRFIIVIIMMMIIIIAIFIAVCLVHVLFLYHSLFVQRAPRDSTTTSLVFHIAPEGPNPKP